MAKMQEHGKRILIVGAGPTGLSLAIMLRQRGLEPVVIERRSEPTPYPAAHVVNTRTQEIFAEIGIAEHISTAGDPTSLYRNVVWAESLTGTRYGTLQIPQPPTGPAGAFSAFRAVNIPQTKTEAILRERLASMGGVITYDSELVSLEPGDAAGPALAAIMRGGASETQTFDLVIGCDGAASTARRCIGVEMEGPRTIARFLSIYFDANLDDLVGDQPAMLHWIGGPDARGCFICFDTPGRTWAFMVPIGDLPNDSFSQEQAEAIIRKAIGEDGRAITFNGMAGWSMSAQVADRYRVGRVVLAGDACHRFPPTGGLGMNTGVQDAHNLAWKIAAFLQHNLPLEFLDTFEEDRRPVAAANCQLSVHNLQKMGEIDDALGVPLLAPVAKTSADGPYRRYAPEVLGLAGSTSDAAAKRSAVQAAVDDQVEHFAQGGVHDLGFVYTSRAITPDGVELADTNGQFLPDAAPGARLPYLTGDGGYANSTLARIAPSGFTIFAAGQGWETVIAQVAQEADVGMSHVSMALWADVPHALETFGIGEGGAVGVRPDGHVFWRSSAMEDEAASDLIAALRRALCLPPLSN